MTKIIDNLHINNNLINPFIMKTTILSIFIICCSVLSYSQNNITLTFNHLLADQAFSYNQATTVDGDYELKIDRLEYYLSEIQITHDGGIVTSIEDVYLLVQPNVENVYELGSWDINSVESVQFGFGVDGSVNTADPALWPSDHPLSFQSPSMHWGWASGYRFLAVEGTAGADFIYNFEIHALGNNNYGMVNLAYDGLSASDGSLAIGIDADYSRIFDGVDVEFGDIVHSTSLPKAINSLNNCKTVVFNPGTVVSGVEELEAENSILISPNPLKDDILFIDLGIWNNNEITLTIFDALGKLIHSELINNSYATVDVSAFTNGMYLAKIQNSNGKVITKRFVK